MAGIDLHRLSYLTHHFVPDGTDHFDVDGNSLELETGMILYSLARRIRPVVLMETGTWKGYSAAFMACALADNYEPYPGRSHMPPGILFTVDKDDHGAAVLWDHLDVNHYVRFTVCDSMQYIPPRDIDILYLDAGHYAEDIIGEAKHYAPFLNHHDSYVLVHDTSLESFSWKAMQEIPKILGGKVDVIEFPNMRGLTLMQRRG